MKIKCRIITFLIPFHLLLLLPWSGPECNESKSETSPLVLSWWIKRTGGSLIIGPLAFSLVAFLYVISANNGPPGNRAFSKPLSLWQCKYTALSSRLAANSEHIVELSSSTGCSSLSCALSHYSSGMIGKIVGFFGLSNFVVFWSLSRSRHRFRFASFVL